MSSRRLKSDQQAVCAFEEMVVLGVDLAYVGKPPGKET